MTTYIQSMKNKITFAAVSASEYIKLRATQFTTRAFQYIYDV